MKMERENYPLISTHMLWPMCTRPHLHTPPQIIIFQKLKIMYLKKKKSKLTEWYVDVSIWEDEAQDCKLKASLGYTARACQDR